ncbi:MAG TPA: HAMP domain-containing sensor histidine kinase [Terriglobia bacterium]|nr:HAMP domain-containing sensor histidine kinase [Terriglobia bacterium]
MTGPRSEQTFAFWFIPALLVCVLVLSGLCLFLIRRQAGSEQNQLREQERLSLDRAQQEFRHRIEQRWQTALKTLPATPASHEALRKWDEGLAPEFSGFWLDDSGVFIFPHYRFDHLATVVPDNLQQALTRLFARQDLVGTNVLNNEIATNHESASRQMLAGVERGDTARAVSMATAILARSQRGSPASLALAASVTLLEMEEISEGTLIRQAALVDAWLDTYEEGSLSLTSEFLPWLRRMHEQCRRRNEKESWLLRERRLFRETRRIQWAEKFLPRLNLLLRRHLYNPARAELPLQVLGSDPSEEPFLVLCQFQATPAFRLTGVVADLQTFCRSLEAAFDQAAWRSPELLVQIRRADSARQTSSGSGAADSSLTEQRLLDPWAAQFIIEARPRDLNAFHRRALQKNLLYLTLTGLTIGACVLVLFMGSRALKEQQRLSKLRSDFLTNVSHELRTPLTAIRLHAETLERQLARINSPTVASAETIVGEVDRLSVLINDVLEFTRLENDRKRFDWERVDLVAVLEESMQLFSQQLSDSGFSVTLDFPESLILRRADRAALKQCAVNLISNCLKFSPHDKCIFVRLRDENGKAVWETEDRGVGVSPEDQPRIFDKFYRSASLDPAISGTGLGLTLCRAFVEAHGGSIEWEAPTSGLGSRFVIRLPV